MSAPSSVNRHDIGDLVTLRATVVGTDLQTPVQPSYFAFTWRNPAGTVATYVFGVGGASVANPTAGCFFRDITVDVDGAWYYRAVATGLVQAAEEWSFLVDPSRVI